MVLALEGLRLAHCCHEGLDLLLAHCSLAQVVHHFLLGHLVLGVGLLALRWRRRLLLGLPHDCGVADRRRALFLHVLPAVLGGERALLGEGSRAGLRRAHLKALVVQQDLVAVAALDQLRIVVLNSAARLI